MCRIAGPARAPRVDDELVQRLRAGERAEHAEHRARPAGSSKISRASSCGTGRERAGIGRPTTRVLPAPARLERVREEEPLRERRREPVREAEVRVRLGQRRRDASVEAAKTIGPATKPPPPSTTSGRRCRRIARHARGADAGEQQRARELDRRPPRQAGDRGTCRARSRLQEPAALRRDPATRRTSRVRRAPSARPRLRARAARVLPSPRLRSGTEAAAALPR